MGEDPVANPNMHEEPCACFSRISAAISSATAAEPEWGSQKLHCEVFQIDILQKLQETGKGFFLSSFKGQL